MGACLIPTSSQAEPRPPVCAFLKNPHRLVPQGRGRYWGFWTLAYCVLLSCVWAFMAGDYGMYGSQGGLAGSLIAARNALQTAKMDATRGSLAGSFRLSGLVNSNGTVVAFTNSNGSSVSSSGGGESGGGLRMPASALLVNLSTGLTRARRPAEAEA